MNLPVVLLPGTLCDSALFAHQLDALGSRAAVGDISRSCSFAAIAACVLADAPPRFALAGLSLGGIVAVEVAHQAPQRVAGLALLDTSLAAPDDGQLRARRRWERDVRSGHFARVVGEMVGTLTIDPALNGQTILEMALRIGPKVFLRQNEALLHRRDRADDLASFVGPILVACGHDDKICPPTSHYDLVMRVPHARLAVVDGAGHLSTLDQPEALTSVLEEWLETCSNNNIDNQTRRVNTHECTKI